MEKADYPEYKEHVALHKILMEKTEELNFNAGKDQDSERVLKFLKDWWLTHIIKEDMKYSPFVKKLINTRNL